MICEQKFVPRYSLMFLGLCKTKDPIYECILFLKGKYHGLVEATVSMKVSHKQGFRVGSLDSALGRRQRIQYCLAYHLMVNREPPELPVPHVFIRK